MAEMSSFKSVALTSRNIVLTRTPWLTYAYAVALSGCLGRNDTVLKPDPDNATNSVQAAPKVAEKAEAGRASDGSANSQAGAESKEPARPPSSAAAGASGAPAKPADKSVADADAMGSAGQSSMPVDASVPLAGSTAMAMAPETPSDAGTNPPTSAGAQDADCDLSGIWIARQISVSEAIGVQAFSNNWYYIEIKQSGTTAELTRHYDCGIQIVGAVTVILPRNALEAQISHNSQTGRKLTVTKDGATCSLDSKRFWSIRGADEARYLPEGVRDSETSIRAVAMTTPLPTPDLTEGATDPDGDGKLGLAFEISGLLSGTRNSVQRDWTRWFTEAGYEIPPAMDWTSDLKLRADFDNEESVLDPREGLLASGSTPSATAKHQLSLRFLGRDASDPRATAIVKEAQVDTCYAIQDALPAQELQ
jgi:hypothetical protein